MNELLFLEKLVFVWVYFQTPWRHIPTKTKLEYPPGPGFGNYAGTSVHSVQRGLKPTLFFIYLPLYQTTLFTKTNIPSLLQIMFF